MGVKIKMPKPPTTMVGIDPDTMRRIAITCRCGNRFVEEVPGEILQTTMHVIVQCKCGQAYALDRTGLHRLEGGMPKATIMPQAPADVEIVDTADASGKDPLAGKVISKGNNAIN